MKSGLLTCGATVMLLAAAVVAQHETIVELVSRGVYGRTRTAPSGRPPSLETILSQTDVIIRGTVGASTSRLSKDGRNVYTNYQIEEAVILYDSLGISKVPAARRELTVTQLGGTITVAGGTYTQTELALAPFVAGSPGLFLLSRTENGLEIAGVFYGAFDISNDRVRPLTAKAGFATDVRGASTAQFIEQLLSTLRH